jgi:hypothetical protein
MFEIVFSSHFQRFILLNLVLAQMSALGNRLGVDIKARFWTKARKIKF